MHPKVEELVAKYPSYVVELSDFTIKEPIGKGGFGEVERGIYNTTGVECAIKKINPERIKGHRIKRYLYEVETMVEACGQFNISLIGFTKTEPYCIVTKFLRNGSLDRVYRHLSDTHKTIIAAGIAKGIENLHAHNIIHRDLKLANILLDDFLFPQICDFGISRFDDADQMTCRIGTPNYMAPEIISGTNYNEKVDIYSYAMILYQLAEGERPFRKMAIDEIFVRVVKKSERPQFTHAPPSLRQLIERCWDSDPEVRPSAAQIFELFETGAVSFADCRPRSFRKFIQDIETFGQLPPAPPIFSHPEAPTFDSNLAQIPKIADPLMVESIFTVMCNNFSKYPIRKLALVYRALLKKSGEYVRPLVKAGYFRAIIESGDMTVTIHSFSDVFFDHVQEIDTLIFQDVNRLIYKYPRHALKLFVPFVEKFDLLDDSPPYLDLLEKIAVRILDSDYGYRVLLIFNALMKRPDYPRARRQSAIKIFDVYMMSKNAKSVILSYRCLLDANVTQFDNEILLENLSHRDVWRETIHVLLLTKSFKLCPRLVEALVYRGDEEPEAWDVLRILATDHPTLLLANSHWMARIKEKTYDVLSVFLILFSNQPHRARAVAMPGFPELLQYLITSHEEVYLKAAATIIEHAPYLEQVYGHIKLFENLPSDGFVSISVDIISHLITKTQSKTILAATPLVRHAERVKGLEGKVSKIETALREIEAA